MSTSVYPRHFVPASFDPSDVVQVKTLAEQLQGRELADVAALEKWLADFSELFSVVDEYGSRRYIEKSCHTDDAEIEKRFLQFVETVEPILKPIAFQLQSKFLGSPHRSGLTDKKYQVLARQWQAEVDLFRQENVPLQTEETKLVSEQDKISGAMMVEFRGQSYTMQQLGRFQEEIDRPTREEAFRLAANRRLKDRDALDHVFDQLVVLRDRMAKNAGLANYREYAFKSLKRFDYTARECDEFAGAIESVIIPAVKKLNQKRAAALGVESLRPWDLAVDPSNRAPLRPFDQNDIPGFVEKTRRTFERLSPKLAGHFDSLRKNNNLDLDSRKGKQPGGYQANLAEARQPFIFMNAAGLHRDVTTLLHEGGHAFHTLAVTEEPIMFVRSAPIEFCEVASMSMELFALDHYDEFYSDAESIARAQRQQLEGIIRFFPWMAVVDQFQQWIYTHPAHDRAERTREYVSILNRFEAGVDYTGLEASREISWQRQMHLFHVPFYYVEYGIAQLGALQLWLKSKQDAAAALKHYWAALSLGGTRTLPELFSAAGIHFDFSEKTLQPLIAAVSEELDGLQDS